MKRGLQGIGYAVGDNEVCVCVRTCVRVCVCVCDAQIIQIVLKLRGSTPKAFRYPTKP